MTDSGGERQYTRLERLNQYHTVAEGDCRLLINLHDYLDCGLFLDHRKVRHWLAKACSGKRFSKSLLLYRNGNRSCGTRGLQSTVSVSDLSHKYLEWAEKNFAANNMDIRQHSLVRADCREWIDAFVKRDEPAFDVIFSGSTYIFQLIGHRKRLGRSAGS